RAYLLWLRGDLHGEPRSLFPRGALEGFGGGMKVPRTVIDDGDVHIGSRLREEPDNPLTLAARDGRRRIGIATRHNSAFAAARGLRLLRQPSTEERQLGLGPVAADRHACEPIASPLERSGAQIGGLEAKDDG